MCDRPAPRATRPGPPHENQPRPRPPEFLDVGEANTNSLPGTGFRAPLGTWNLGTCPQFNTPFVR